MPTMPTQLAKTGLYIDPKIISEKTEKHRLDIRTSNKQGQIPSLILLEKMIPQPKNQENTYTETNIYVL